MRHFLFILLLISGTTLWAQNPDVNRLREAANQSSELSIEDIRFIDELVIYGMFDSASFYIEQGLERSELSDELRARLLLSDAKLATAKYFATEGLQSIELLLSFIESHDLPDELVVESYLQALKLSLYFVECEIGLQTSYKLQAKLDELIESDSLKMMAHLYHARLTECNELSDTIVQKHIRTAEEIAISDSILWGKFNEEMALYHFYFNRPARSVQYSLVAELEYRYRKDTMNLGRVYHLLSEVYESIEDIDRSLEYILKAKPYILLKYHPDYDDFLNSLGWSFYRAGQMDSALYYIKISIEHFDHLTPGNPEVAYSIGNLGLIYFEMGELENATKYSTMAIEAHKVLGDVIGEAEANNNLGFIEQKKGNRSTAVPFHLRALELVEGAHDQFEEIKTLKGLYEALGKSDPREALEYHERYSNLRLEQQSKEESVRTAQLEAAFIRTQNKSEIQALRLESELKSIEIERKNTRIGLITFALIFMVLIAGLIFFYWLQRRRLTAVLTESNEINQRIISMISHDFRGPLNNVKLTLELLQAEDMELDEFKVLSKDLYRQSADLALMFDSFVGWAIAQREGYVPSIDDFDWNEVISEAVNISEPLARLKNIELISAEGSSIQMHTDRMACSLILRNLISNAIKYSHNDNKVEVSFERDGDMVTSTVKDYGVGMSPDKLNKIMLTGDGSKLGTNNEYGAGLGLRMVVKYVHGIGGKIEAQSEEGKGTTFWVRIPCRL